MPQDPWAEFEEVRPAAQQRRAPQPVISLPDADKAADNARADAQLGLSQTQTAVSVEGNERADAQFKEAQKRGQLADVATLRNDFYAAKPVVRFQNVWSALQSAVNQRPDTMGDRALIYSAIKTFDPEGAVPSGDIDGIQSASPIVDGIIQQFGKQVFGGGTLPPEIRRDLLRAMNTQAAAEARVYNQFRSDYRRRARDAGLDEFAVVGSPVQQAGWEKYQDFLKREGIGPQQQPAPQQDGGGTTNDPFPGMFDQNGNPLGPDGGMAYDKDGNELGLVGSVTDTAAADAYNKRLDDELARRGFDPNSGLSYIDRFSQGALLGFADEIYGLQGGAEALFGNRGVGDGYTFNRDLWRRGEERQREAQGMLGTAAELGGGLLTGFGSGAAKGAAGLARQGAIQGGIAGFGYGEGAGGSLGGAGFGAAVGGVTGGALGKAGEALAARAANRAAQPLTEGGEVIAAADRLNDQFGTNIRPIPADVGQQGMRNATGAAAKMPISAALIGRTRDQVTEEAEKAVRAIASLAGTAEGRTEIAGEAAIEAANTYIKRSKTKVDALYTKARTLAGGQRVTMPNAQQQLQSEITNLGDTPGGATGVSYLEELLGKLDGDWPVDGVKRFRKQVRDKLVKDNLTGSEIEAAALRIVDAADEDITAGLVNAGKPEAAKAYAEASAAAAERYRVIDEAIAPFIGKSKATQKSGEDVIKAIEAATATKSARLSKFMANIPAEDAANLRATLIERIGRPAKGAETAETTFSLDRFLTNWNGMTDRAKGTLFGGELRAALDDLARVASGRKEAGKSVNFSNTGGPVGWAATGGGVVGTITTGSILPVMLSALDGMTGAVLASPKFARWLAKMPSNPKLAEKHVAALSRIAANDNVIAADVAGLQQVLMERLFPQTRAAASPPIAAPRPSSNEEKRRTQGEGQ